MQLEQFGDRFDDLVTAQQRIALALDELKGYAELLMEAYLSPDDEVETTEGGWE